MNMLAAAAEAALWGQDQKDRSVVDTFIEEFPERMGELASRMHEIYGEPARDFIQTM